MRQKEERMGDREECTQKETVKNKKHEEKNERGRTRKRERERERERVRERERERERKRAREREREGGGGLKRNRHYNYGTKKRNNTTIDLTHKRFAFIVASSDSMKKKMTLTSYTKHWKSWTETDK